jgi:hypothetical protein
MGGRGNLEGVETWKALRPRGRGDRGRGDREGANTEGRED